MKTLSKTIGALGFTLSLSATLAFSQVIQFDENGHITVNGGPDPVPVPFQFAPDPSGGLPGNVAIYQIPLVATSGDVGLLEQGSTSVPSDLVRFFTPSGANFTDVIFYSDIEAAAPDHDIADTGLPTSSPNTILISEVGPENNNGATYTPAAGGPGFPSTGVNVVYQIISDVPEPGSASLVLLGLATLLGTLRLRRNRLA